MAQAAWRLALATLLLAAVGVSGNFDAYLDSTPFVIVVEHADERRCLASLVSRSTALSTASCALPAAVAADAADVWALAASLRGARPRPSPAAAARRVTRLALAGAASDRADPAMDLALLHLEAPFDDAAKAIPIVMESTRSNFGEDSWLYALHALLPAASGDEMRARVVNLTLAPSERCVAHAPLRRRLCLAGADGARLCASDLGGGVVCDGKLCGVLSQIGGDDGAERCSDVLVAHSLARWRRFIRCAHTGRQCGRGDCNGVCTERDLLGNGSGSHAGTDVLESTEHSLQKTIQYSLILATEELFYERSKGPDGRTVNRPQKLVPTERHTLASVAVAAPTHTRANHRAVAALTTSDPHVEPTTLRTIDFEPNRADFKTASDQSSPVPLKAGEYGDNAAEYPVGGDDTPRPAPPSRTHAAPSPAPASPTASASPSAAPLAPAAPALLMSQMAPSAATALLRYQAVTFNVYFYLFILTFRFI